MSEITKRLMKLENRAKEQEFPEDGFMAALGFTNWKNKDFMSALNETAKVDWADYK